MTTTLSPPTPTRPVRPETPYLERARPPQPPGGGDAPRRRRGRAPIPALTGVRVVLAAWIVAHHLIRWLCEGTPLTVGQFGILRQGQAATSGFFVLGGIGLYWAYGERLVHDATLASWGRYLRRRWAAVWPVGVLGALLAVPFELGADIVEGAEFVGMFVMNALLLQAWLPIGGGPHGVSLRFDGPTWTLSMLLFWYATFPVVAVLVHRRLRTRLGLLALGVLPWLAVVAMAVAFADEALGFWFLHVHPFARGADLLAGVAIGAWIVRHGRPSAAAGWLLQPLAVAAVVGSAIAGSRTDLPGAWLFGAWYIPCMALLAIALTAEGGPLVRLFAWRALERPGRVAFAMLMLHVPFISLGWQHGLVHPDRPVAVALLLVGCLAISWIVHLRIERPLVRRLAGPRAEAAIIPPAPPSAATDRIPAS